MFQKRCSEVLAGKDNIWDCIYSSYYKKSKECMYVQIMKYTNQLNSDHIHIFLLHSHVSGGVANISGHFFLFNIQQVIVYT